MMAVFTAPAGGARRKTAGFYEAVVTMRAQGGRKARRAICISHRTVYTSEGIARVNGLRNFYYLIGGLKSAQT